MEKEKVYNTSSKRYLQINGQQYKKLIHDGYKHIGNELIPPTMKQQSPKKLQQVSLTNDVLYEIMLKADIDTVHQYCLTNKNALNLCQDKLFWKMKFNYDSLPLLYQFPKENFELIDKDQQQYLLEENYIKQEPNTWKQWEQLYKQTQLMMTVATRFVNEIINTGIFMEFDTPEIKFYEYLWLPVEWFEFVHNLDVQQICNVPNISYEIIKKKNNIQYKIHLIFDDIGEKYVPKSQELILSKQEFILYFAKLLYFHQNYDIDEIFLADHDEGEPKGLWINDFLSQDDNDNIKNLFPDW
jgi:hypothetical protein